MSDFKAIETEYNGYKFRSRLEARWAVFFDDMEYEYQYEPEGYTFDDGTKYLPDFYLPGVGYYVEVKGKNDHIVEDMAKIWRFVEAAKKPVVILSEIPYSAESKGCYLFPSLYWTSKCCRSVEAQYCLFHSAAYNPPYIQDDVYLCQTKISGKWWGVWTPSRAPTAEDQEREYKSIQAICSETVDNGLRGKDSEGNESVTYLRDGFDYSRVQAAILKARKARFEHGECVIPSKEDEQATKVAADPPDGYKYIEKKTTRLQLVLQPSLMARIKAAAKVRELSVNEYCHRILAEATKERCKYE